MRKLDRFPTELLYEIFDHLCQNSLLGSAITDVGEIRNLRLVNRVIGEAATRFAFKEILFCMWEKDLGMLQEIANDPVKASYVTRLIYAVDVLHPLFPTLEKYTRAVREQEETIKKCMSPLDRFQPPPPLSQDEIVEDHKRCATFCTQQQHIRDNKLDYDVLKRVVAQLPNLRNITVAQADEHVHVPRWKWPYNTCLHFSGESLPWVGDADNRHLRAMLYAVQEANIHLRTLEARSIYSDFFDSDYFFDTEFGLQGLLGILDNLTTIKLSVDDVKDLDPGQYARQEAMEEDYERQTQRCRSILSQGLVRRLLDSAPNLVTVDLWFSGGPMDTGCPTPARLQDVLPTDRVWPKLEYLSLVGVEFERQQILRFIHRHRTSLRAVKLANIEMKQTSWRRLVPDLRATLRNLGLDYFLICGTVKGRSEDDDQIPDMWQLAEELSTKGNMCKVSLAISEYIVLSESQPCPLPTESFYDDLLDCFDEEEEEEQSETMDEDDGGVDSY